MRRAFALFLVAVACAPAASPLKGVLAPDRTLPAVSMPAGHRHLVFTWDYEEGDIAARGDGSIRTASPDSARLDFFLGGGLGAGGAILIGDSLRTPRADLARRYLPPTPLLWAALGRLVVPALRDTVVRVDGLLTRADIGRPLTWRVALKGDTLIELQHISNGKIAESLTRGDDGSLTFNAPGARRTLRLIVVREEPGSFDASIWSL
ncbi:MAG: hypothetical protein ACRENK_16935 [Gemmatimonadaceae bacterium]